MNYSEFITKSVNFIYICIMEKKTKPTDNKGNIQLRVDLALKAELEARAKELNMTLTAYLVYAANKERGKL